ASSTRIAVSPDRSRLTSCPGDLRNVGLASAVSLKAASPRPHREELLKAASRTMVQVACFETRTSCAPQHEAGWRHALSYAAPHEDVLVEPRPVLVFTNVVRAVGEIQLFDARARPGYVAARRIVAELLIEPLALPRHHEIQEQHGGVRMRRLAGDRYAGIGHRNRAGREPAEWRALLHARGHVRIVDGRRQHDLAR